MIAWAPRGLAPQKADSETGLPALPPQPASTRRIFAEVGAIILVAALMVVAARFVAVEVRVIPSASMVPQLEIQDRVLLSRLSYARREPRRGDIVVFPPQENGRLRSDETPTVQEEEPGFFVRPFVDLGRWIGFIHPPEDEQDLIKRVIGLPGETVEGRDGAVYINGRQLIEPYLTADVFTSDFDPIVVPRGGLWVMGDNRGGSADSRTFGPIRSDSVIGRAFLRIWPVRRTAFI